MAKPEELQYLTELTQEVNIQGAVPYLKHKFNITEAEAQAIVSEWLSSKLITEAKSCGCGL